MLLTFVSTPREKERRAGETQAFETLYAAFHYTCVAAALAVTGDRTLAEDAAHNTFLELLRHRERYLNEEFLSAPKERQKSLLTLMSRHNAIDLLRARRRCTALDGEEETISDSSNDPGALVESREDFRRLTEAVGALPEPIRQVFELRYYHDMSYAQIAEFLGISETNVSVRLSRGRKRLRELLERSDDHDEL